MPVTNQKAPKLVARSSSGALSAIIRAKMPCVSAMCAPHSAVPMTRPAKLVGLGEHEVAGDQHRHPGHQDRCAGSSGR